MFPKLLRFSYSPGPHQRPIVSLSRQDLWIAFGLAITVILLGAWQMVVGVCGTYHDDAIYVITAKALALGKGYRLIDLPMAPLQSKFPILYPALLAIIWKIWPSFPQNLLAMQGITLLCGASTISLAYLFLVRFNYTSRGIALVCGLFAATSAFFLFFSSLTLSETPYALISILALWAIEKQTRFPTDNSALQIVMGLLLALPFLTRDIGFVLVPAGLLTLHLAGRRIRWVSLGAALIVLPWIVWMLIGPKWSGNPVNTYYTNYLNWWYSFGWLDLSILLLINLFYITISIATVSFGLFDYMSKHFGLFNIICIFIGSVTILGILKQIKYNRLLAYYLLGYLFIIMIWPWPPPRFLVPILPFLLVYLLNEIWEALQNYHFIYNKKLLLTSCFIILFSFNLGHVYQAGKISREMCYPVVSPLKEPISWPSYEDIFYWINTHTLPNDIIASGLDSMVYLYTGRRAFRPFQMNPMDLFYFQDLPTWTMEKFIHILKAYQPKYLIQTPLPGFGEERPFSKIIKGTIIRYPGLLKTVYVGKDKRFLIYKIQTNRLSAANY
jgi:hypothetical protein